MRPILANTIESAVGFLRAGQMESGEFAIYTSLNSRLDDELVHNSTPFVTTFAIHALQEVTRPDVSSMLDKACKFLLSKMEPSGLWRYWYRTPLPADADDTACSSHALISAGVAPPKLAENRQVLFANRDQRGLFHTWLDGDRRPIPNDVDGVVNANVVLYLGDIPETRPAIDYLNQLVESNKDEGASWYYIPHQMLHYAMSRLLRRGILGLEPSRPFIVERTLRRKVSDGSFGSDLNTAMSISTLLNCGYSSDLDSAVDALVRRQLPDGSWGREAFYGAPRLPPPGPFAFWYGSAELTTVLCLEAIALFSKAK
ncbi:prenyltransferase/squalene oxidase repeat-containing protein [Sorangium sp. So ce1128]